MEICCCIPDLYIFPRTCVCVYMFMMKVLFLTLGGVWVSLFSSLQGWSKYNAFHICITSYNIAVQDHRAFKQKRWKYLILDEVTLPLSLSNWSLIICTCTHTAGSEHQEFQEPALADPAQFQQPASPTVDWHSPPEQPDGAVVPHALPHASRLLVPHRIQGMVLQPSHRNGRG